MTYKVFGGTLSLTQSINHYCYEITTTFYTNFCRHNLKHLNTMIFNNANIPWGVTGHLIDNNFNQLLLYHDV